MHDSERYGHLILNGKPMPEEMVARHVGVTRDKYVTILNELKTAHVPRFTKSGILFSKRMVSDAILREKWRNRQKNHRDKKKYVTPSVTPVSRPSSSSSSSSSSIQLQHHSDPLFIPTGFETFWEQYPKKVGKPRAQKAWEKIPGSETHLGEILAGLELWKSCDQWVRDSGQFIPHPATFLNDRRYNDKPTKGEAANDYESEVRRAFAECRDELGGNLRKKAKT